MKTATLLATALAALCGCDALRSSETIVGAWKGEDPKDGTVIFHEDGRLEILDAGGRAAIEDPDVALSWSTVTEVVPHQLYVTLRAGARTERVPFGIYKLAAGKLIVRDSTTYDRTLGGISLGTSRHELPRDFNGVLRVFVRQ